MLFSAIALLACATLLGRIFSGAFEIIFFLPLFRDDWVAKFSGSIDFSLDFWILSAIIAFSLYRVVATQNKFSKTTLALFCPTYMLATTLRVSMSYEFLTSIILFLLAHLSLALCMDYLQILAPFLSLPARQSFKYCWGFLSLLGWDLGLSL